jgi:DNA-binding beta-propeller fold protein YncE
MRIEERLRRALSARAGSARPSEGAWDAIEAGLARRRRRRTATGFVAAGAAVVLLAVSTAWLWAALRGTPEPGSDSEAPPNPRVTATIPAGDFPAGIAAGEGAVWVAVPSAVPQKDCAGEVIRIEPGTNDVTARIPIHGWPSNLAVGFGSVWVEGFVCDEGGASEAALTQIDPETNSELGSIPLGGYSADVAVGEGAVWVTVSDAKADEGEVVRIDPVTTEVTARVPVEGDPRDVLVGEGGVWVLSRPPGGVHLCPADDSCLGDASPSLSGMEVLRIDPDTNQVVATFPDALSVGIGEGALWMSVWLTEDDPGLVRVDPATGARDATLTGDFRGFAGEHGTMGTLVVGDGGVWLWGFPSPDAKNAQIYRLNASTLELDASVSPGGRWIDAALDPAGGTLWISNYDDTVTRIDLG